MFASLRRAPRRRINALPDVPIHSLPSRNALKQLKWLLVLLTGLPLFGGPVAVTLEFVPNFPTTPRGFTHFIVNGQPVDLLCDDADAPLNSSWPALELSLGDDLSSSLLGIRGDPLALQKYQWMAILSLRAYEDPSFATDIREALRYLTDPSRIETGSIVTWLTWVQEQNPAIYDLSNFRVFSTPLFQEQVGLVVPEPLPVAITPLLIAALYGLKWSRCRRNKRTSRSERE